MSASVSLWTDEAVTISAADRTLGELWALIQRIDAVHGLYYAFMNVWVDLFGASPLSLRLPSAIAAGATALGVYVLAGTVGSPRTAVLAGIVAATLPRLTWGGIEARPFIFSALAATWATVVLVQAIRRRTAVAWLIYGAVALVGVAINIYLTMLVAAHAITVLMMARRDKRAVVGFFVTSGCVAVTAVPLLLLVRSQQAQLGGNGDRSPLSIARKILVNQFFLGETPAPAATSDAFTRAWQLAAIVACCLGLAAMMLALVRRGAVGDSKAEILALAVPWIVIPTALVAMYAIVVAPIYQPRYFTFTAPAAALLIAAGLRTLSRRWYTLAGIVLYACAVLVVYASQRVPFAKSGSDWSAASHAVEELRQPDDAVYFAPRYAGDETVTLTTRRIAQSYPAAFEGLTDTTLEETGAETASLDGHSRTLTDVAPDLASHDRVWALYNSKAPSEVFDESARIFAESGFTPSVQWDGPSTLVVLYAKD
jgi:mannosyltransferase